MYYGLRAVLPPMLVEVGTEIWNEIEPSSANWPFVNYLS